MSSYWKKRANQRFAESERFTEQQLNRIIRLYNDAQRDLKKMIDEIYARYGKKTGLDRYTMERIISSSDLNRLIRDIGRETGKDISGLVKRNFKSRINRLQAIQLELQAKLDRLTEQIEHISKETLTNVTRESYQRTMFDVGRKERFDTVSFASLNDRTIDRMLETKWVGNGNYSDRIWKNQNQMVDKLSEIVTRGAMTGMSVERMQMEFRQTFQVEKYKAERLLRTEMAYFHNEAEQESYRDLGIEQYIYIATLDNRTSEVCSDLDGKVFKTKDGKVGVNLPPMHPNCRSTTGPYYNDSILKDMKRRARDQEGVGKEIEYKNYREWEAELKARGLKPGGIKYLDEPKRMKRDIPLGEWEGTTGSIITKEQKKEITEYANNRGIEVYNISSFDGDIELLKREIDVLEELIQEFDPELKIRIGSYPMESGDYGITNKFNIAINSRALRDAVITSKNMQGYFANPTIEGIGAHEFGHVLENKYGKFGVEVFKKAYYNVVKEELSTFDVQKVVKELYGNYASTYSGKRNQPLKINYFYELTSEIISKYKSGGDEITNEFVRLVKEIINEKNGY